MTQTVNLQEIAKPASAAAAVSVVLQDFNPGDTIELTFWEDDSQDSLIPSNIPKSVQKIGTIEGDVVQLDPRPGLLPLFSLVPSKITPAAKSKLKFIVAFAQPGGAAAKNVELALPDEKVDIFEGESWEVFVTVAQAPNASSPTTRLSRVRRALSVQKGEATYSHYVGHACNFHHDGSTDATGGGGYFNELGTAIDEATDFIFIADWSFHPHARLRHRNPGSGTFDIAETIGAILIEKAQKNPAMLIVIHVWDHTDFLGFGAPDPQNDNGDAELDRIAKQKFGLPRRPTNLLWRMSSRTGNGFSHHQKFVVMDAAPADENKPRQMRAFIGGLDITKGRFDFGGHPILTSDAGGNSFTDSLSYSQFGPRKYDDWYNNEFFALDAVVKDSKDPGDQKLPRQPWHDIALHFLGPACWDLVREFVGRWRLDPAATDFPTPSGASGDTGSPSITTVTNKYRDLFLRVKDPTKPHNPFTNPRVYAQQWEFGGGPWAIQVCRSMKREHWESTPPVVINMPDRQRREFRWTVNGDAESSIHRAYFQAITQAEQFVYIETQYFISSGSMWGRTSVANVVAINLAQRAIDRAKSGKDFHIYIVIPMFPEGAPDSGSNRAQRQFQWATIRAMATRIEAQSGKKAGELMSVFFLANWHDLGGSPPDVKGDRKQNVTKNKRYQIYVHSKFMLIDDRFMIIGSANLNERSLNGARDSEIAVAVWPSDDSKLQTCINDAQAFRKSIWTEHLGPKFPPADFANPGSAACVAAVRKAALENYVALRNGKFDSSVHGHLCLWPLETDPAKDPIQAVSSAPETDGLIPDRPFGLSDSDTNKWRWHSPGSIPTGMDGDLPE